MRDNKARTSCRVYTRLSLGAANYPDAGFLILKKLLPSKTGYPSRPNPLDSIYHVFFNAYMSISDQSLKP